MRTVEDLRRIRMLLTDRDVRDRLAAAGAAAAREKFSEEQHVKAYQARIEQCETARRERAATS